MQSLGPLVGMALLGLLLGWLVGRAVYKVARIALLALVAVIGLELIGYHIAKLHWDTIAQTAQTAAGATRAGSGLLWRLATYNLPFTAAFIYGFWKALPRRRKRQ